MEYPGQLNGEAFLDRLESLFAYDSGAVDAGVRDEGFKDEARQFLLALDDDDLRVMMGAFVREAYLSPAGLAAGYGLEDVVAFAEWLDDLLSASGR